MKIPLTLFVLGYSSVLFSQPVVDVNKSDGVPSTAFFPVNGTPFVNVKYVRLVSGSPFFSEHWMNALALTGNGKRFRSKNVKLDLIDNSVHFINEKGDEFVSNDPFMQITLTDTASNTTYDFFHSSAVPALSAYRKGWYRQLVAGKVVLYQQIVKTIQESKPYNSPVAEQRVHTQEEYLVLYNGTVLKARKPKDLPALLTDGKTELENFLKSDKITKGTAAEQMTALINHYNSLQ